jgi:hypothetical protein
MQGTYLLSTLLIISFILWPEETADALTTVSVKIQIYFINLRLRWAAWRMYRSLVKICKEVGFPAPGPFVFIDLWDRESLD